MYTHLQVAIHIEKRDFWIIRYAEDDPSGRQLFLNIYETVYAPDSGQLSGFINEDSWDVVVIMTTDWLLVARLEPQRDIQKTDDQGKGIWKVALKELEKDRSLTIMFSWILGPLGFMLKPNRDLNLGGTYKRPAIYEENFTTLCVLGHYGSHKSLHQSDRELFKFESQIVIHDKDTTSGMGGTECF